MVGSCEVVLGGDLRELEESYEEVRTGLWDAQQVRRILTSITFRCWARVACDTKPCTWRIPLLGIMMCDCDG
jgi:hypothetical protein